MPTTTIKAADANLEKALEDVRASEEEAKKFVVDPEAYLQGRGVSTEGLNFAVTKPGELSDDQLDSVAGGGFCASVGIPFVCASVGW